MAETTQIWIPIFQKYRPLQASRSREINDLMADYGFVAQTESDPKRRNVIFNRQELSDNWVETVQRPQITD